MRTHRWILLLVLGALPLWLALGEPKDPKVEKAKALFNAATVYYNDKDYEKALSGYKDAYNTAPLPVILFNIAQCYRLLNQHQEAVDAYRKFLIDDPSTQYRVEVEGKIKDLESALAEKERFAKEEKERLEREEKERLAQLEKEKQIIPATIPLSQPIIETPTKPNLFRPYLVSFGFGAAGVGFGLGSFILSKKMKESEGDAEAFRGPGLTLGIMADLSWIATGTTAVLTTLKRKKQKNESARLTAESKAQAQSTSEQGTP